MSQFELYSIGLSTDTCIYVIVIVHVYTAIAEMLSSIELGNIRVRVSEIRLIGVGNENQSVTGMQ